MSDVEVHVTGSNIDHVVRYFRPDRFVLRVGEVPVAISARRMKAFLRGRDCPGGKLEHGWERWMFVRFVQDMYDGTEGAIVAVYSSVPYQYL